MSAPAVALIAERRVIARLMRANAVSPDSAQPLDGLRWAQARRLTHLLAARVVREAQPGRFYLDAPTLLDHITMRRRRAMVVLLVVFAFALFFYFL